jgi:hypothetical protein
MWTVDRTRVVGNLKDPQPQARKSLLGALRVELEFASLILVWKRLSGSNAALDGGQ